MDQERLKREGRLAEKGMKAKELDLKARGLVDSIRNHLDPLLEEDIAELDVEVAVVEMAELFSVIKRYREVSIDIKALKKALGK